MSRTAELATRNPMMLFLRLRGVIIAFPVSG
jgi:hypothetical protein